MSGYMADDALDPPQTESEENAAGPAHATEADVRTDLEAAMASLPASHAVPGPGPAPRPSRAPPAPRRTYHCRVFRGAGNANFKPGNLSEGAAPPPGANL